MKVTEFFSSAAEHGKQVANLLIDLLWRNRGMGDLSPQQGTASGAHPLHGHLDRGFGCAECGGKLPGRVSPLVDGPRFG